MSISFFGMLLIGARVLFWPRLTHGRCHGFDIGGLKGAWYGMVRGICKIWYRVGVPYLTVCLCTMGNATLSIQFGYVLSIPRGRKRFRQL